MQQWSDVVPNGVKPDMSMLRGEALVEGSYVCMGMHQVLAVCVYVRVCECVCACGCVHTFVCVLLSFKCWVVGVHG